MRHRTRDLAIKNVRLLFPVSTVPPPPTSRNQNSNYIGSSVKMFQTKFPVTDAHFGSRSAAELNPQLPGTRRRRVQPKRESRATMIRRNFQGRCLTHLSIVCRSTTKTFMGRVLSRYVSQGFPRWRTLRARRNSADSFRSTGQEVEGLSLFPSSSQSSVAL